MARDLPPGIYRIATAYIVIAQVGRRPDQRRDKRFPLTTALRAMVAWQEATRAELRQATVLRPGTLAADVRQYLGVITLTTQAERTKHLELWVDALGAHRRRDSIRPVDLRTVLEMWRRSGLSGATCNKRLAALSNVWTVLDGRGERNPCKSVEKYPEAPARPRELSYELLEQILAAMPDVGRGVGANGKRLAVSHTKARLRAIAYCGLPHIRLKRLQAEHIDWLAQIVWLEGRRKGAGRPGHWHPVGEVGLQTLRELIACGGLTPTWSTSAMWKSFRHAAAKLGRPDLTPYDCRHLYASTLLRLTGDTDQVRELLDHSHASTTRVYTGDAVPAVLREAVRKFSEYTLNVLGRRIGATPHSPISSTDKSHTVH